jgi:hypothetical protein
VAASPTPSPPALPDEVQDFARRVLQELWAGRSRQIYEAMLLPERRKDTAFAAFEGALVGNVVAPSGKLGGLSPSSSEAFTARQSEWFTQGLHPAPEQADAERKRYAGQMWETWWQVDTARGPVLAALTVVRHEGGLKVQSLWLCAPVIGTLEPRETPAVTAAVRRLVEAIRRQDSATLYDKLFSAGLRQAMPRSRLEREVVEMARALPDDPSLEVRFLRARRYYSAEGWALATDYVLPGKDGQDLWLHATFLDQPGYPLAGLEWSDEPPAGLSASPAASP